MCSAPVERSRMGGQMSLIERTTLCKDLAATCAVNHSMNLFSSFKGKGAWSSASPYFCRTTRLWVIDVQCKGVGVNDKEIEANARWETTAASGRGWTIPTILMRSVPAYSSVTGAMQDGVMEKPAYRHNWYGEISKAGLKDRSSQLERPRQCIWTSWLHHGSTIQSYQRHSHRTE